LKIVLDRQSLLPDLFPNTDASDSEEIKRRLEAHYGKAGLVPTVTVNERTVVVELDTEAEAAFGRDYDRASALAQSGKYAAARGALETLIQKHPAVSDLHRMLAQVLFEDGDGEAAVDPLIESLRWDPENKYALLLMGNVQFKAFGDVDTAKRYYDRAAAIDPDDHLTLNNLGAAMMEASRYEEARRYFVAAKEAEPDYPNTHLGLALMYARQNDMVGAFTNAVRALQKADQQDPVFGAALDTARQAAAQYDRQTPAEDLFRAYAKKVEEAAGKPIEVEEALDLQTPAKIEIAEYRGRDRHVVKYQPGKPAVAHLVAHELAHLDLISEAREAGTSKLFTTNETLRRRFIDDHQRDVQKFVREGVPGEKAAEIVGQLVDGLNNQVYNAPVDLFIEHLLHDQHLALRPVQFLSLYGMLSEYAKSSQSKEIKRMTPRRVFEANVVYNLTHALQFRDLYGVDLTGEFDATRNLRREADRLYAEFLEIKDDRQPGEEYELVRDWAADLKVDAYFELVDEGDRKPPAMDDDTPTEVERAVEDTVAQVHRDPLNLNDPEREREEGMSLEGSPAASMAVTMYLLDALQLFEGRDRKFVESVAFEVAMLGNYGLDADDPAKKYTLRAVPGKKFSALHLLAYMYAGFKEIEPGLDAGLQFDDEYERAKGMHGGH